MYIHYDRTRALIVPELTVPQEKAMINEFNCALKPKAYTKIVQASMKSTVIKLLSVQLEENYFYQFQVRFLPVLDLSIV